MIARLDNTMGYLAKNRTRWDGVCLFVVYLLLSIVMTWPIAAGVGTHIPSGGGNDVFVHFWTLSWLKKCLLEGLNPFFTTMIFYPDGVSLTTHNIAWAHFLIWFPLQAIFGAYPAFSMMYILIFTLNCLGGYLLAKEWTHSRLAAFIGGLVFGFWPSAISRSGQPNLNFLVWIPLSLVYLGRTIEFGKKKDAILAGVFIALIGWVRWQVLIMASIALAFYILYFLLSKRIRFTKERVIAFSAAGLVALGLIAPIGWPVVADQLGGGFSDELYRDEEEGGQTDLFSFFLPNVQQTFLGRIVSSMGKGLQVETDRIDFIGYLAVLLSLYGVLRNWRSGRFWLILALLYIVLGLGPVLKVGGIVYDHFPMPYRFVEDFFLIRILRKPHRFNVLIGLPIGMMVAVGTAELLRRIKNTKKQFIFAGLISVLVLAEYCQVPYSNRPLEIPGWFSELKDEPGTFGILDLPMGIGTSNKRYMFYQLVHEKPLVEGHISRPRVETFNYLGSTPFLSGLLNGNTMDPKIYDVSHQLEVLAQNNVRYIILHKTIAWRKQLDVWEEWLAFEPMHADEDLLVYRTEPEYGRDFSFVQELGDGIGVIRADYEVRESNKGPKLVVGVDWGSEHAPEYQDDVCINLIDSSGRVVQTECESICEEWPTSRWGGNEVVRGEYKFLVDPVLLGGSYDVEMYLESDSGEVMGTGFKVGRIDLSELKISE